MWSEDEEPLCEDCWEEQEDAKRAAKEQDRLEASADDLYDERKERRLTAPTPSAAPKVEGRERA